MCRLLTRIYVYPNERADEMYTQASRYRPEELDSPVIAILMRAPAYNPMGLDESTCTSHRSFDRKARQPRCSVIPTRHCQHQQQRQLRRGFPCAASTFPRACGSSSKMRTIPCTARTKTGKLNGYFIRILSHTEGGKKSLSS